MTRLLAALRRARPRIQPRTAYLALIAVLVLAGAAYAVTSIGHSRSQQVSAQTPWLGVRLVSWPGGVLIAGVAPGGPADAASLHPGDLIIGVAGRPVVTPINVVDAVDALSPGQTLELEIERGANSYSVAVRLAGRPSHTQFP